MNHGDCSNSTILLWEFGGKSLCRKVVKTKLQKYDWYIGAVGLTLY